jgi:ribosomal protein L11 methyltransferase
VIRLAVRVRRERAELVLAELLDLAPGGVEEVEAGEQAVEFVVYGPPGELPDLPDLKAAAGDALVEISTSQTPDDWHERWKRFHRAVLIEAPSRPAAGQRKLPALHIRPPWEAPMAARPGEAQDIVIDPGQAFGTGAHASTRLCLEMLLELAASEQPLGPLLDVGTGTGVLAIAAARIGFEPVLALDNESESVEATRQNARVNGVELDVCRLDVRAQMLPWVDATTGQRHSPGRDSLVVVANLLRPLLLELARTMPGAPAHLVAGGLLKGEVEEIADAFRDRLRLRERMRKQRGDWAAVWLAA